MRRSVVFEVEFDGAELKAYRLAAGMGRRRFAKAMNVQPAQICRWETNVHCPSKPNLDRIVELLGCAPADLYRVID